MAASSRAACSGPAVSVVQQQAPSSRPRPHIPCTPLLARGHTRPLRLQRGAATAPSSLPGASRRSTPGVCRALFGLGLPELLVIGGVAVVLFGPKQLPEIGKSLGKTVKGFQEAAQEFQTELKEAAKGSEEDSTATPTSPEGSATAAEKATEGAKVEPKK